MRLFLIRHGETVDNVAGLYAGSRDSALTNHGVEQTKRLGGFLARENAALTHIFASPLSRAFKTAQAIHQAQEDVDSLEIVQVPDLRERDFGRYEGKPYTSEEKTYNSETKTYERKTGCQMDGIELGASLDRRSDSFIVDFLLPLFALDGVDGEYVVAVVAHGMLLSHLWRRLLLRFPRRSLTIAPEITAARGNLTLEHLGGWSNTGYLELAFTRDSKGEFEVRNKSSVETPTKSDALSTLPTPVPPTLGNEVTTVSIPTEPTELRTTMPKLASNELVGWSTTIVAVDSKLHLLGLKRQRGGIGSLAHDEGQRKLEGFFSKRQRTD